MGIITCGQFDVLGPVCPNCERSIKLPAEVEHRDQHGVYFCSEDCISQHQEWLANQHLNAHMGGRDLLCTCGICLAAGLPSQAMLDEYAAYLASIQDTPLDPAAPWQPIATAPTDGTAVLGFYGHPERGPVERVAVRWAEERVCMLADTAPGAGQLGSGWEDVENGLYVDTPTHWRPLCAGEAE